MKKHFFQSIALFALLALMAVGDVSGVLRTLGAHSLAQKVQPKSARAAIGDGVIVYDETSPTTSMKQRITSGFSVLAETTPFTGSGTSKFVYATSAPNRQEMLLGVQDTAGTLTIYRSADEGANWTTEWSVTVGDGNLRRFDIAYEETSGDALVVYSGNAATTNELRYRTWDGTSWVGPTNLDPIRTSGIVHGIQMASRPSSNEIGIMWADANSDVSANFWNGTSFTGEPAAALETNLSRIGAGAVPTNRAYDLAFESLSGDLMVVWGIDGTADPRYVIKPNGGGWGATQTATGFAEEPVDLDISASPISDRIAYGNLSDNGNDTDFGIWSGSAWGAIGQDFSSAAPVAGSHSVSATWLIDGANEVAIFTYPDASGGSVDWFQSTNGGTPSQQTDYSGAPAIAGTDRVAFCVSNPSDQAEAFCLFEDANADIFIKRASLSGTTVTWTSLEPGGVALELNASVTGFLPMAFTYSRFVASTLTIDTTDANKVTTVISSDTAQYMNALDCTSVVTCAAFTMTVSNAPRTVTSITLTQTGTAAANTDLSNLALFYDTDGNFSNGTIGQYGATDPTFSANAATVTGSLLMNPGTTYYFYVRVDIMNSSPAYPRGGQTINFQIANNSDVVSNAATTSGAPVSLAGTTTVKPKLVSTTYGAGLGDGGRSGESLTLSGFGFGIAPVSSRANCAGAVNTGCVRFIVGGSDTVADSNVTAWSNTSITWNINAALASDGGTSALEVVAGGQNSNIPLTFFIYPNITGMTTCAAGDTRDSACGTNAAQEYAATDTHGLVQLNGDHFKVSAGTVQFTGSFGSIAATVHGVAEGPCSVAGWTQTSVCIQVSPTIADNVHDGTVTLTRSADSKTDVTDLHILPRILTNTPTSGIVGDTITIDGNHFCQTGACPGTPPTADYQVYFGATPALAADFVNTGDCALQAASWSNTRICVKVPVGTPSGSQDTKVIGRATPLYESQRRPFTILSTTPTVPDVGPGTDKGQYRADATTVIAIGGYTNQNSVVLKADISASVVINMALQVEVQPVGTPFTCAGGACVAAIQGTIIGGGACNSCTTLAGAEVPVPGLLDNSYHWQARVRNTTTNEYSAWVSFGSNLESAADFIVDTVAPVITNLSCGTPGTNTLTITWDTSGEASTSQVQYNLTGTFGACSGDCTTLDPALVFAHSVPLSNLASGTTYYFRARSADAAQNESISSTQSCSTQSVGNNPGKTVSYFATARTTTLGAGITHTDTFSLPAPENTIDIKTAWIRIEGITAGTGTNTLDVEVNGQPPQSYILPAVANSPFVVLYQVSSANVNLNDSPSINSISITPSIAVNALTAVALLQYSYAP